MSAQRTRRPTRRAERGYTAIEVMLAMTVLLISSAGVMSMQKAAIQGNVDARKLDVANSIARTWLDRLATDSETWNSLTTGLTQTTWLGPMYDTGLFMTPTVVQQTMSSVQSPAFDILGRDLFNAANDPTTVFCTHIKVDHMAVTAANLPVLIRVTVLVYWAKQLSGGGVPATQLCSEHDVANVELNSPGTYHMLYVTEALRSPS
jgi:prepilin-type N-terminal cleavage/methylation domain-containing protein